MKQHIKNVVLVHGAFADGSGWKGSPTSSRMMATRCRWRSPPRLRTPTTKSTRRPQSTPWTGQWFWSATATAGPSSPRPAIIQTLRRLSILPPLPSMKVRAVRRSNRPLPQASKAFKPDSNGLWWIDQAHFVADFAADIPRDEAEFMAISQVPISTDSFTHQVKNPAWKHKPTWYMVATEDRSINPDQERMMAKRAKAKTVEVKASHVAYMSHPKETAKLIEEAATSRQHGSSLKCAGASADPDRSAETRMNVVSRRTQ